ncbi:hypothetical protein IFM89_030516 [Coptis chinensis]|uniref:Uncharacterized protein n=1 Tax=Coptis chinensis TaxID=261450 RepID=A0A835HQZ2_9MAGN|nr:hypothetical protein IFM89_030516 [Coptis chinensis]
MVFLSNCGLEKFSLAISSKESNSNVSLAILSDNKEVMKYEDMLELNLKLDLVILSSFSSSSGLAGGASGVGGRWFSGVVFGMCGLVSAALPHACYLLRSC